MSSKKSKFLSSFSSVIKPMISEERDKLLSIASLQELKKFIPDIDFEKHIDLLPVAFDACVINRPNKNGDMIDTDTALSIYKNFINKFIDTEHNRQKIIGVILTASLSEFGTNRLLSEQEVIGTKDPFYITLGGILWKSVNGDLCDLVEDSNDPTSINYMSVSASWELGFSDYDIAEMDQGEKNFGTARILNSIEEIEGTKKYLKSLGGSGVKDGKCYYRMPKKDVIPMGIGLTENPAAEVKGVAIIQEISEEKQENIKQEEQNASDTETLATQQNSEIYSEKKEIISQTLKNNVKKEREYNMKITSIQDITDENLKQCSASVITEFIAAELQKANESFSAEKAEKENMHKKLQEQHDELHKSVSEMKATIDKLNQEKQEKDALDTFNGRMSELHGLYDFPSSVAKHVVDDVKACASEDMYAAYKAKAEAIFSPFKRKSETAATCATEQVSEKSCENKEVPAAKAEEAEAKEEVKASVETKSEAETKVEVKESVAAVVEEVLENSKEEKISIPNSSSASAPGLKEKFKQAFAEENFIVRL